MLRQQISKFRFVDDATINLSSSLLNAREAHKEGTEVRCRLAGADPGKCHVNDAATCRTLKKLNQ